MAEFSWEEVTDDIGQEIWRCRAKQATVEIYPRPTYCDRGRWQAYVDCPGFPRNPRPFDSADGFPRYYFDLDRAKAEIEDLFRFRNFEPVEMSENNDQ